jgi:plasmid maintenance system antidote protein VapI
MVDTQKLRGKITEEGKTHADVAKAIGVTPKTFSEKLKKGVFLSNEMEIMIDYLNIEDPMLIFFAPNVT